MTLMIRHLPKALASLITLVIVLCAGITQASAAPPTPTPAPQGTWVFTASKPEMNATHAMGKFGASVDVCSSSNTLRWYFQLSSAMSAMAVSPMDCKATLNGRLGSPYSDYHPNIPASYLWHSSIPALSYNTEYKLEGNCRYNAYTGTSYGNMVFAWAFRFKIDQNAKAASMDPQDSTLDINSTQIEFIEVSDASSEDSETSQVFEVVPTANPYIPGYDIVGVLTLY